MNNDELNELLKEKSNIIFRYLIKLGASKSDAEDVVQDTMYKAILHSDGIIPEKFTSWLFRVAVNQYYDLCRRQKRDIKLSEDSTVIISQATLEERLLKKEERRELYEMLNELNPTYKQVLLLKYEFDLSYREIAELMNVKEEVVKTWLHRARNQFKKLYGRIKNEQRQQERF